MEDNNRVILRLRELLLGFGAAGRQSVEQLKNSSNPAVRRMAIDLLRVFGGREALPELASMLDDADPQVQRESIRAIVQIATHEAYAVLERALVAGSTSRDTVLQQLIGLRDDKAIPLLCYVLNHSAPRGKLVDVHAQIIEALGGLERAPGVDAHAPHGAAPRRLVGAVPHRRAAARRGHRPAAHRRAGNARGARGGGGARQPRVRNAAARRRSASVPGGSGSRS